VRIPELGSIRDEAPERSGTATARRYRKRRRICGPERGSVVLGCCLLAATLVFCSARVRLGRHRCGHSVWGRCRSVLLRRAIALLRAALSARSGYTPFSLSKAASGSTPRLENLFLDGIKAALLSFAIVAGLSSVLYLFEIAGSFSWFTAGLRFLPDALHPLHRARWILPLSTRTRRCRGSSDPPLRNTPVRYGFRSRTSCHGRLSPVDQSNAFFTGSGAPPGALFDTLISSTRLRSCSVSPTRSDILKSTTSPFRWWWRCADRGLFFPVLRAVSFRELFHAFGVEQPSVYAGLVLFVLLCAPLDSCWAWCSTDGRAGASVRRTGSRGDHGDRQVSCRRSGSFPPHLSHLTPHPFYVFLNYSHPP